MIDILIPTYNGGKYLKTQLDSIHRQTVEDWRILLRDDGSTDDTLTVVREWQSAHPGRLQLLVDGDKGLGVSQSFARLIEYSTAPFVMLCDQDDYWHPQKAEKSLAALQVEELRSAPGFPLMVCADLEIVDSELQTLSGSFWNDRKDDPAILQDYEKLIAHSVVTGNTILLNRPAVDLVIPIKTKFFLYDQWISIKVAKFGKVVFVAEPLVKYRQHGGNVLGSFRFSKTYLLNKIKFLPYYVASWMNLKKELEMDFSVFRVLVFKISYNLKKVFNG